MILFAQENDPPWWASVLFFVAILAVVLVLRKREAGFFERLLDNDLASRGIGLLGIAFGSAAAFLVAYAPIHDAFARKRIVLFSHGAIWAAAAFVLSGLILLFAGRRWRKFLNRDMHSQTNLQWATAMLIAFLSLGAAFGSIYFFHARGYTGGH